jgi:hypothetical protein
VINIPDQHHCLKYKYLFSLIIPRNCTTALKECVPILATYEALKSQFDWLSEGSVSKLIDQNLPIELGRMEMYVR